MGQPEDGLGLAGEGGSGGGAGGAVLWSLVTAAEHRGCVWSVRGIAGRNPGGVQEVLGGPRGRSWRSYGARVTGAGTCPQKEACPSAGASRIIDGAVRHWNNSAQLADPSLSPSDSDFNVSTWLGQTLY